MYLWLVYPSRSLRFVDTWLICCGGMKKIQIFNKTNHSSVKHKYLLKILEISYMNTFRFLIRPSQNCAQKLKYKTLFIDYLSWVLGIFTQTKKSYIQYIFINILNWLIKIVGVYIKYNILSKILKATLQWNYFYGLKTV